MRRVLYTFIIIVLLLGVSCQEEEVPPPSAEEIIAGSATRMTGLTGFHFVIQRSGAPAFVDPTGALIFRQAEGDFTAPDSAQANVRLLLPGLVTQVDVIAIGDVQWQTNPLNKQWEQLPAGAGFNPSVLFDNEVGLPALLTSSLTELTYIGRQTLEEGPDLELEALTGVLTNESLIEVSGGLMGAGPMDIELWVAPETSELYRVILTEIVPDQEEARIWQLDFSRFNETVTIEPPL